jgi:hypothetical protein
MRLALIFAVLPVANGEGISESIAVLKKARKVTAWLPDWTRTPAGFAPASGENFLEEGGFPPFVPPSRHGLLPVCKPSERMFCCFSIPLLFRAASPLVRFFVRQRGLDKARKSF